MACQKFQQCLQPSFRVFRIFVDYHKIISSKLVGVLEKKRRLKRQPQLKINIKKMQGRPFFLQCNIPEDIVKLNIYLQNKRGRRKEEDANNDRINNGVNIIEHFNLISLVHNYFKQFIFFRTRPRFGQVLFLIQMI